MKTPRDLLLDQHRHMEDRLDAIRVRTVRAMTRPAKREETPEEAGIGFLAVCWQELFQACRRYWMGLGVAWCVIVAFALVGRMDGAGMTTVATASTEPVLEAAREQWELRNEMLGVAVIEEARVTRHEPVLGPRSEMAVEYVNV